MTQPELIEAVCHPIARREEKLMIPPKEQVVELIGREQLLARAHGHCHVSSGKRGDA